MYLQQIIICSVRHRFPVGIGTIPQHFVFAVTLELYDLISPSVENHHFIIGEQVNTVDQPHVVDAILVGRDGIVDDQYIVNIIFHGHIDGIPSDTSRNPVGYREDKTGVGVQRLGFRAAGIVIIDFCGRLPVVEEIPRSVFHRCHQVHAPVAQDDPVFAGIYQQGFMDGKEEGVRDYDAGAAFLAVARQNKADHPEFPFPGSIDRMKGGVVRQCSRSCGCPDQGCGIYRRRRVEVDDVAVAC